MTAERDPPAPAPSRLARTRAEALPAKTAPLRLEVPLIVTIASWVLPPGQLERLAGILMIGLGLWLGRQAAVSMFPLA